MIRVVLDANIYISALHFGGTADRLLESVYRGDFIPVCGPSIQDEVEGTLSRKFNWSPARIARLRPSLWLVTEEVVALPVPRICRDPKDDHVLGICVSGKADLLVTGDKDLLILERFRDTRILTPARFMSDFIVS